MKNEFLRLTLLSTILLTSGCHQSMKARDSAKLPGVKFTVTMTTVAKDKTDLPRCDFGTEGLKAYISDEDSFVQCSASRWHSARPGDTTNRYEARTPVRYHEWFDAKSKRLWSTPVQSEVAANSVAPSACRKGWKLPTEAELVMASQNGLFDGIKAHGGIAFDKAWTDNVSMISGISRGELEMKAPSKDAQAKAGVYCVAA